MEKTFRIISTVPTITLTKASDQCDKTGQVSASFSGAGEYSYSWEISGATVVSPTNYATSVTENFQTGNVHEKTLKFKDMIPSGATVTFKVTYNDGTGSKTVQQQVQFENYHMDNLADIEAVACKDHEYHLNATIPSPSSAYKGQWTWSGQGNIDDINDPGSMIRGLKPGNTTTATWTITRMDDAGNAKCTATQKFKITDNTITISGSAEQLLCGQTTANISTNVTPTSGLTATWTSDGTATIAADGTPGSSVKAKVSNLAYGMNKFTLKLTATGCTDVISKDFIIYNSYATAQVNKDYVCTDGEAVTLTGNDLTGLPNATGHWVANGSASIVDPNANITQAYISGTGDVSFTWYVDSYIIDQNGNRQECHQNATTTTVVNRKISKPVVADACVSDDVTSTAISATTSTLPSGATGKWEILGNPAGVSISPVDKHVSSY